MPEYLRYAWTGENGIVRLMLRDRLLWKIYALLAALLAVCLLFRASPPALEAYSLGGQPSITRSADDPALHAVKDGAFPALNRTATLGEAFAGYKWFSGPPKWVVQGPVTSRTVLVVAPLDMPGEAKALGIGSGSALVFYTAEFGLSGDGKSFKPLSSTVDMRDGSNKLLARVKDPQFLLLKRVMLGYEPGVSFKEGIRPR